MLSFNRLITISKLKHNRNCLIVLKENTFDLQHNTTLRAGCFQGFEQVIGQGLIHRRFIESYLAGKGTGMTSAPFQYHLPDRIEGPAATP